jgi:Transglutaminase-like superfamily
MNHPTIITATPTTLTDGLAYALSPDAAVLLMDDGSARILDMADRFYAVPPIGALMLVQTLQHGREAAARHVARAYGVAVARVTDDLNRLLAPLEQAGVILPSGCRRRQRRGPLAGLAARLVQVALRRSPLGVRAPALLTLATLSLRLFGWSATLAAWRQQFPLRPGVVAPHTADETARAIDEAVCSAAAANPLGVACKERGLCCWALARSAGLPAELVIGVERFPLVGHCWCEVGPRILSDHPENVACYLPVLRY